MKYRELLQECRSYDLEYEAFVFLVTELSGISKRDLIFHLDETINSRLLIKLKDAINKYVNENIPVQYIVGYTYFYGLKIKVNPAVLIPRFDTEEVVEKVLEEIKNKKNVKIIDIGTGSGCIALALKKQHPLAEIYAVDISEDALICAKENALENHLDIYFQKSDLLRNVEGSFDIIVSNPPYIAKNENIDSIVYDNEPHLALFSDNNGLYHYEEILKNAKSHLNENGIVFFEIPSLKGMEMIELVKKYFNNYEIYKDLNNNDRIMKIW